MTSPIEEALRLIANDRVRAHEVLFRHRHRSITPPAHAEMIKAFHSSHPRVVGEAFRGFGKSTIGEEAIIVQGALVEFKNALVIGASYERACERLESIAHEYETNEDLEQIFGPLRGTTTWMESKKILTNGVIIQAKGAGQSLRGVKHHDIRPDYVLIDDLEDEESVRNPESRNEMLRWLYKTLMPALAPDARIRFVGNRLDPAAVIVKIAEDASWKHMRFPIMYKDLETGEDQATWPHLFPLSWIYAKRDELHRLGLFEDFNQEYMCEADTPQARIFRPEHFNNVVIPRVRTWEAVWVMVDPAKSQNKRSATTALVAWSWVQSRLIVWDCRIGQWLPDETIAEILAADALYRPVVIGIEEDALNQYIMQPLRQAQLRHGQPLPIRAMAAKKYTEGRGKEDFIQGLQPFFQAKEVVFAKPLPELVAQFLSFPKGHVDGPNALAYAMRMRPGAVMFEEFSPANVIEEAAVAPHRQVFLALHAKQSYTLGVLLQYDGATLTVIADFIKEGDPGQAAAEVIRLAQFEALGKPLRLVAPGSHFEQWSNVGLQAAVRAMPAELKRGGDRLAGREEIRRLLQVSVRQLPALQVAHRARWVLNGFSGGYARAVDRAGRVAAEPEDNTYNHFFEALECLAALMRVETGADEREGLNWQTSGGRRYLSAMPTRR